MPSWYPTPDKKIGSFFQEQAALFSNDFDIRVLYIDTIRVLKRKNLFRYVLEKMYFSKSICRIKKIKERILKTFKAIKQDLPNENLYLIPPLYYYHSTYCISDNTFQIISVHYINVIKQFLNDGWVPDVIHAQSVGYAGVYALRIHEILKIPYIITEHNFFALTNFDKELQWEVKKAFENAARILTVSYDKTRQLLSYNINIEPIVVWNLVDEDVFLMQNKYKPFTQINITSFTAASHIKDNITLLKVLNELKKRQIPFLCEIVGLKGWGSDAEYSKVIDYIKNNKLEECVKLSNFVPRNDIPKIFENKHVFLLTSIAEGLSVSLLEALSSGLMVIATRHGGAEDIIINESYGRIVNVRDYLSIVEHLSMFYEGKLIYEPHIIRQRVIETCGKKAFKERLENIYLSVINNN
jgi:glycosyltransferase involved in cell wall biosynthesis